jgi:hypothetical protein
MRALHSTRTGFSYMFITCTHILRSEFIVATGLDQFNFIFTMKIVFIQSLRCNKPFNFYYNYNYNIVFID